MLELRELQFSFGDALLDGATPEFLTRFKSGGLPNKARFKVYRNNFYLTLGAALRDTYPVIEQLVGREFFSHMADHYVRRFPSTTGNLHDYGRSFAEFLRGFAPVAGLTYLPDVARLEWTWHRSFHADEDVQRPNLGGLYTLGEDQQPQLRFRLNPSARLVASGFPVLRIWQVHQAESLQDDPIDLAQGGQQVLVLRREWQVEMFELSAGEYLLLERLAGGETLSHALEAALEVEATLDLEQVLHRHMRLGTLHRWYLTEAPDNGDADEQLTEIEAEDCDVQLH